MVWSSGLDTFIPLLAALIFGGLGLAVCWAATSQMRGYARRLGESSRADGVVVRMLTDHRDSDTNFKYPVVRFITNSGQAIEFEASIRREPPRHKVGDAVPVYYDPKQPEKADIVGTDGSWMLLLLGIPFLLAGVFMFFRCVLMQACGPVQ